MEKRTTIQIEHKTLEKLKKIRNTKRETYDEIINRLIREVYILSNTEIVKGLLSAIDDFKKGKYNVK